MENADYLVIGGGLAGGSAVNAIRKKDTAGRVVLATNEQQLPYDRVPLSKGYLINKVEREKLFIQKNEFYERQRIEILKGRQAKRLDLGSRKVKLDDDREISFNKLLIATGGRPKKIPFPGSDLQGVYYLRTIDDCDQLKDAVAKSKNAVVIGGGFIGCELAAAFAAQGLSTTILEMGPYLLNMAIDEETGQWIGDYHSQKGVNVMVGSSASVFLGKNGHITAVKTKEGKEVPADFVAIGVGITPNTEIAQSAGLKVENGIVVNEFLESASEGIYAAGDVARFFSPIFSRHLRVEHYDIAVKHGMLAGSNMAGDRKPFIELPYFFSYQFDLKIHAYGDLSRKTQIVKRGSLDSEKGFFQFYFEEGQLGAVLSVNRKWEEVKQAKNLVLSRKTFSDTAILEDESKDLQSFS